MLVSVNSDKNSKKARDLHLLKTLKISLKDNIGETGNVGFHITNTSHVCSN